MDELALLTEFRDQLPPELFTQPFRFAEVETPAQHRANLLKARELLAEAGWAIRGGVLRDGDGEPFELEFLSQDPEDARLLLPYFRQLKRLGIVASLRLTESTQFINRLRGFDFDAMLRDSTILMPPIIELKPFFHTESAVVPLSRNPGGISHPVVDILVEKAILARTMREVIAVCRALDRVLLWEYFQLPLDAVARPRTVYWDKFGRPDFEPKYWPPFPDGWWYDPGKAARIDLGN
ncbi:MAG: ABC transporter substrate-binding protein [Gammaproteobacteria bacterium]|nr:ABC transporter substrate-binding protein [Gammaproteobacteria bacterium]